MSAEGWKRVRLNDLVDEKRGISYGIVQPGSFLESGGVPILKVNNLTEKRTTIGDVFRVSEEIEKKFERTRLQGNEILISLVGSLGYIFKTTEEQKGWNVVRAIGVLPIKENINRDWVYWCLKSSEVQEAFRNLATVTVQATLNLKELKEIEIPFPDEEIQTRIANILSALDDKIELNRQTNATLEAIAQAIFKEWFVDFRFPGATGEMQDSELGSIPKGWRVNKLGDLIDSVSVTHKFEKKEVIFLNTSDIEAGKVLHHNFTNVECLPGQAKKSIQRMDILFTEIRPANKRFALIDFDPNSYVVSTKLMVLRAKTNIHPIVIYNYLTNNNTLSWLQHLAESRSGTFPQITFDHIRNLQLVLPKTNLLISYSNLAWANFQQIKAIEKQNLILSSLRDALLPKLMSGEIAV